MFPRGCGSSVLLVAHTGPRYEMERRSGDLQGVIRTTGAASLAGVGGAQHWFLAFSYYTRTTSATIRSPPPVQYVLRSADSKAPPSISYSVHCARSSSTSVNKGDGRGGVDHNRRRGHVAGVLSQRSRPVSLCRCVPVLPASCSPDGRFQRMGTTDEYLTPLCYSTVTLARNPGP